jgi:hypothetical protein
VWVESIVKETKSAIKKTIKVLPFEEVVDTTIQPKELYAIKTE